MMARALLLAVLIGAGCKVSPAPRTYSHEDFRVLAEPVSSTPEEAAPSTTFAVVGEVPEPVDTPDGVLRMGDVLRSVEEHFPLLLAAQVEIDIAVAKQLGAQGAFDMQLKGGGRADLEGYYENERWDLALEQPLALGGIDVIGGYRVGQGDFASYDGKARTNEDGEVRLGLRLPLLRGRTVDSRRVGVWRARLTLGQAEPKILKVRLQARLDAAEAYWKWVGAGRKQEIVRMLLQLAEDRREQVELAVEEGELAPIALTENERLIVSRQSKLFEAEREFQRAAITLSLFVRDPSGRPVVPAAEAVPPEFPEVQPPDQVLDPDGETAALGRRPEVLFVELRLQDLELQHELARNDTLPDLDVGVFASQDMGAASAIPDDKDPFEFSLGFQLNVPLQRSAANGRLDELTALMRRGQRELYFAEDRVRAEVQDAVSAVRQSSGRLDQAARNVVLAEELMRAETLQVQAGESDLFRLNLREQQAAVASEAHVKVLVEYFRALARYRAALGQLEEVPPRADR